MNNITWTKLLMATGLVCFTTIAHGAPAAAASQGDAKLEAARGEQDSGGELNTPGVEPTAPAGGEPANHSPTRGQPDGRSTGIQPAAPKGNEPVAGQGASSQPSAGRAKSESKRHRWKCYGRQSKRYGLHPKHLGCHSKHLARHGKHHRRKRGGHPDGVWLQTRS